MAHVVSNTVRDGYRFETRQLKSGDKRYRVNGEAVTASQYAMLLLLAIDAEKRAAVK